MSETPDDFNDLRRLLKLKQHEVPPPGYFNILAGDVMSRIRSGESGGHRSVLERLDEQFPRLAALLRLFEAKPGLIGGLATSVCVVLLGAVIMVDRSDEATDMPMGTMATAQGMGGGPDLASAVQLAPADNSGITVSTNPVSSLQPVTTLFNSSESSLFQPAAFTPAGQ
jgi:hypothetical protein